MSIKKVESKDDKKKFYYTFGTLPWFPYYKGWVEVIAKDQDEAHAKFRARFPDLHKNTLCCAFYYTAEEFEQTIMYKDNISGEYCHEIIE